MNQASEPLPPRLQDLATVRHFVDNMRRQGGRKLPSETKLVEQLGITRARLRGLLKVLEKEGLIWRHVGKGTFIGERSLTGEIESMSEVLSPPEAFEARLVHEPQLAALAAQRATPEHIADMRKCLDQMRQLSDFDQWAVWDERLHRTIAKAANNRLLLAIYDTIRESAPSGMRNIVTRAFSDSTRDESNNEHARIIEAIAAHDSKAAESAVRNHLRAVRQIIFSDI